MKRLKEFTCANCETVFTRPKNRLSNGRIDTQKLIYCDKCFKVCEICNNRHGRNGSTCSKDCIKTLREQTNLKKYGEKHNWSKGHPGRISYEETMLERYGVNHNFQRSELRNKQDKNVKEKYGVDNIFQLNEIKEKIKITCLQKYGVENPKQNKEIINKATETFKNNLPQIRKKNEKKGLWIPLDRLTNMEIYYRHVNIFTNESLRLFGENMLHISNYDIGQGKGKFTIDHMFSRKEGFLNDIPPQIIGSIVNLEILEHSANSGKGSKCSIARELLYNNYNLHQQMLKEILNENKISKHN